MNRNLIWLWGMLMLISAVFTACNNDDTLTADPNSEWALKNSAYLDSIAAVAANPPAGERWEKYLSYKLQNDTEGSITTPSWGKNDYVYAKVLPYLPDKAESEQPAKGATPLFTDSVMVHYRGMYYNGTVFDQSFSGDWDADIHEPVGFMVSGLITGWSTALMHLQENSHVMLYIPYTLGYGEYGQSDLPGYSTLVFDLRLEKVLHKEGPDDRSRKKKTAR